MEFHNHITQLARVSGGHKRGTHRCCLGVHPGSNCQESLGIGPTVEDRPFGRVLEQEIAALEQFNLQSLGPTQKAITGHMWELEEEVVEQEFARRSKENLRGEHLSILG